MVPFFHVVFENSPLCTFVGLQVAYKVGACFECFNLIKVKEPTLSRSSLQQRVGLWRSYRHLTGTFLKRF